MRNKTPTTLAVLFVLLVVYLLSSGPVLCLTLGTDDERHAVAELLVLPYVPLLMVAGNSSITMDALEWYINLWAPLIFD